MLAKFPVLKETARLRDYTNASQILFHPRLFQNSSQTPTFRPNRRYNGHEYDETYPQPNTPDCVCPLKVNPICDRLHRQQQFKILITVTTHRCAQRHEPAMKSWTRSKSQGTAHQSKSNSQVNIKASSFSYHYLEYLGTSSRIRSRNPEPNSS